MGNEPTKEAPKQDLNSALFQLKMSAKRFQREATKAEKEKAKNLKSVEACLKKGDEESARLFATNAQNNINDHKKYLRMGSRLEFIANQLKSNAAMSDIMGGLTKNVNPILMQGAESMDIKDLYKNFDIFKDNFDKLTVNAGIMGENFDTLNSEGNTVENADQLFNQVRNKVFLGGDTNVEQPMADPTKQVQKQPAQAQTQSNQGLDDYIKNLKDL